MPEALKLDFNEPEYPMTVQDQIALDNHRLNLGLVNKAELMVEYNKDLTIEEANAKLCEYKRKATESRMPELIATIDRVQATVDAIAARQKNVAGIPNNV